MHFIQTHISEKGNHCVDKIASVTFYFPDFHWWDTIPRIISEGFYHNRAGLRNFSLNNASSQGF